MNTFKRFASMTVLSSVLIAPALALAADSSGASSATLANLPCQAEMKAYMAKYPVQLPTNITPPGSGGAQMPSTSTLSAIGSVPTGMGDAHKDTNMNSAEGKALQDCLSKNTPKAGTMNAMVSPGSLPAVGAMKGDSSTSSGSTSENGCPIITRTLGRGSRGGDVTSLQTYLISQTLLSGSATGYFGGMTVAAVKSWQLSHNISPTGTVGPKTRAALIQCNG